MDIQEGGEKKIRFDDTDEITISLITPGLFISLSSSLPTRPCFLRSFSFVWNLFKRLAFEYLGH
jgi:hypothetical protein